MSTVDYVIVGAGSAGCVLAARLSEDPDVSVLLVEAGGEDTRPGIAVPSQWATLLGTEIDWGYEMVPQRGTAGYAHGAPRGKVLGGSSSINGMMHLRGHPSDYDGWAAAGCAGWDWESVLPYFQRMETAAGPLRGTDGPLRLAPSEHPHPVARAFVDGAVAAGFPATDDFNGPVPEGAGWHDLSIVAGARQSSATAYLAPARGRPNLTVLTGVRALRLVLRGARCVGVEVTGEAADAGNGASRMLHADREVVVCAGALDSPRLLLLSGIGPADELLRLGVDARHDLPGVGRNLHDHPLMGVVFEAAQPVPPGLTNNAESSLLWRSDDSLPGPDMQMVSITVPYHRPHLSAPANSYSFGVSCVLPDSRGTLTLGSDDPADPPLIDPGYFTADGDVRRMVHGIEVARRIAASAPMREWHGREVLPGPDVTDEAGLRDYVAQGTLVYHHYVGTCAMGTGEDAVVDPELRVHGIEGLRVADASVMPRIVGVNTNAATVMIGEKAADLVRGA